MERGEAGRGAQDGSPGEPSHGRAQDGPPGPGAGPETGPETGPESWATDGGSADGGSTGRESAERQSTPAGAGGAGGAGDGGTRDARDARDARDTHGGRHERDVRDARDTRDARNTPDARDGGADEARDTRGAPRGGGLPSFSYTAADEEKRRGVRRMKTTATALLVLVAGIYALTTWGKHEGAGTWAGYVAAAAEAGMVGALADWFAVTALFRHPLGLPIPHTAIIPNKKDQLGASLAQFVGENFLSADVVRARLRALGIGRRVGAWLAEPAHADRVVAELATALRGAITVLRDSDVQAVVGEAITRRADAAEVAPVIGKALDRVVADGAHHRAVDLVCVRGREWLIAHEASVMDAVQGGAPGWTPRFVDRRIGDRVYKELLRFVTEMRDMPSHPARGAIDRFLKDFAGDLQSDTETRGKIERLKSELIARPEVQDIIASAWSSVRSMIISAAEDERSELRLRARSSLLSLGGRLATDERLQGKLEGWIEDAASYVVSTYRGEITSLITDTVKSWNADDTSKKIEAHIGRDLQFIRINGTVVGALAGLLIYTVSQALGA